MPARRFKPAAGANDERKSPSHFRAWRIAETGWAWTVSTTSRSGRQLPGPALRLKDHGGSASG